MERTRPPYRADHVGSILRSDAIHAARAQREKGEIDAAELKAVEDREIRDVVSKQEEVGLKAVTDGEFRRSWWHFDFLGGLEGVEMRGGDARHPVPGRADQGADAARSQARSSSTGIRCSTISAS